MKEFRADQMSPRNLGSQINISMCYTRIDKINISSMKVLKIDLIILRRTFATWKLFASFKLDSPDQSSVSSFWNITEVEEVSH